MHYFTEYCGQVDRIPALNLGSMGERGFAQIFLLKFFCDYQSLLIKCQNGTLKQAMTASFHFLSKHAIHKLTLNKHFS
jgi:hypothetical protein